MINEASAKYIPRLVNREGPKNKLLNPRAT